jgi:hypothetical protein
MKKIFLILILSFALFSCNSEKTEVKSDPNVNLEEKTDKRTYL